MSEPEAIKASDLVKLMEVVKQAAGLYNAIEAEADEDDLEAEWSNLGAALRDLGLIEVT